MSRFIAAMDHSGGSTGGVLERYGQEYTEEDKMDKVHAMRMRMVNSSEFNSNNIWGAILYQDTVKRDMVPILKQKGIVSFLKIDSGCDEDGTLKQFPVKQMIELANEHGCYGTKMRSIVHGTGMIDPILKQQFTLAETIYNAGLSTLIPIIEPEIPIDHPLKAGIEAELYDALDSYLHEFSGKCILKLTLPTLPDLYHDFTSYHNVEKVVALSGGYATMEACRRLRQNTNMSASFSRALSEGLNYNLTDAEFDAKIKNNIKQITEASS